LYSNLRFVISASFVACAGLIGVLAFLPATLEERLASAEDSIPSARACNQQNWWHFDRNCLSRRGMPWVADLPTTNTPEVPSADESTPEPPSVDAQSSAAAAEEVAPATQATASGQATTSGQATASGQEASMPPPLAEEPRVATQPSEATPQQEASAPPAAEEPHIAKQRKFTPARHAAPAAAPLAEKRHAAKPAAEAQPHTPTPKKAVREDRGAKQTNEALNAVRKFQDNLRDIPVSSYAADGTRRTIVIRPTSIQDVYYYSAPR
jgi:hypothetical protein